MPALAPAPADAERLAQNADKFRRGETIESLAPRSAMEPKYDGWRVLARVDADSVTFFTRANNVVPAPLPVLAATLGQLPAGTWLDGEAIIRTGENRESWHSAQSKLSSNAPCEDATFAVFDVIAFDGMDARTLTYDQRRGFLERIFAAHAFNEFVELAPQLDCTQETVDDLMARGFEGAIIKDRSAPYRSGTKGGGWTKVKPSDTLDGVVMGFNWSEADSHRGLIRSIIVGQYDASGELVKVADCSGMNMDTRRAMSADHEAQVGLVIEVAFIERHPNGSLKSPNFKGYRPDKPARECVVETGE